MKILTAGITMVVLLLSRGVVAAEPVPADITKIKATAATDPFSCAMLIAHSKANNEQDRTMMFLISTNLGMMNLFDAAERVAAMIRDDEVRKKARVQNENLRPGITVLLNLHPKDISQNEPNTEVSRNVLEYADAGNFDEALKEVDKLKPGWDRAYVLPTLVCRLIDVGQKDQAVEILAKAHAEAAKVETDKYKELVLSLIAVCYTKLGDKEAAARIFDLIAKSVEQAGKDKATNKTLSSGYYDIELTFVVLVFAGTGDYDYAYKTTKLMSSSFRKLELAYLAYLAARAGNTAEAEKWAEETAQVLQTNRYDIASLRLAAAEAALGHYTKAMEITNGIDWKTFAQDKASALAIIGTLMAEKNTQLDEDGKNILQGIVRQVEEGPPFASMDERMDKFQKQMEEHKKSKNKDTPVPEDAKETLPFK
jgi:tetratricopeptide (TPR) repeat protein